MNFLKKQKFSIRKFSVGTFSTLIATLVFLSHPGHAATHDEEANTSASQVNESTSTNNQDTNAEQPHSETITPTNISNSNLNSRNNETNAAIDHVHEEDRVNSGTNSAESNVNHNEQKNPDDQVSNVNHNETTNENQPHRRGKRSVDNTPNSTTTNTDPMAVNEQNSGQIINAVSYTHL